MGKSRLLSKDRAQRQQYSRLLKEYIKRLFMRDIRKMGPRDERWKGLIDDMSDFIREQSHKRAEELYSVISQDARGRIARCRECKYWKNKTAQPNYGECLHQEQRARMLAFNPYEVDRAEVEARVAANRLWTYATHGCYFGIRGKIVAKL